MDKIVLIISIFLLLTSIKNHAMSKANVKVKIKKEWYDRIWTGSRPSRDNLTEEGLAYRKQSNLYAIAGFMVLGVYVWLNASTQ